MVIIQRGSSVAVFPTTWFHEIPPWQGSPSRREAWEKQATLLLKTSRQYEERERLSGELIHLPTIRSKYDNILIRIIKIVILIMIK